MIGIDIGDRFIKLVALRKHRDCWQMQACIACETGGDPAQALRAALQQLPSALRRKLPPAAIALPVTDMLIKTVQLPSDLSNAQVELALTLEFEQLMQTGAENICLDYYSLDHCLPGHKVPDHSQLLLAVACRQALVDGSITALAAAGLTPALVSADIMLIADTLISAVQDSECDVFIDAGATGVRLHSLRTGVPDYSRAYALAAGLSCDDDPAAYLLLLRRALQQYRMFDMLAKPAAVFLYGGAAVLTGVQELLQQSFVLPVQHLNPLSEWQAGNGSQVLADTNLYGAGLHATDLHATGLPATAFALACALAKQDVLCR